MADIRFPDARATCRAIVTFVCKSSETHAQQHQMKRCAGVH
jgi:hypothetical protein